MASSPAFSEMLFFQGQNNRAEALRKKVFGMVSGRQGKEMTLVQTVKQGHVHLMPFFKQQCTSATVTLAARYGKLKVLRWLYQHQVPVDNSIVLKTIISGSENLEIIQFLAKAGCSYDYQAANAAASNGKLSILMWLYNQGVCCTTLGADMAAKYNNWQVVKWLHQHHIDCTSLGTHYAISKGNLRVLQYIHAYGTPLDEFALVTAARGGHLEIFDYLISVGASTAQLSKTFGPDQKPQMGDLRGILHQLALR